MVDILSSPADNCVACHRPLPPRDLTCPSCGAVNSWRVRTPDVVKRKRFLWATVIVHGSDLEFVQVQGRYLAAGRTMIMSKNRWIVMNLVWLVMTAILFILSLLGVQAGGDARFWFIGIAVLLTGAYSLYLFVWSLLPPRAKTNAGR